MGKITLPTTASEMFSLIIKEKIVQGILSHISKVIKVTPPTITEWDMRSILTYALSFNRKSFMLHFNHFFGEEDKELAKFAMKLLYDVKVDSVSRVSPRIGLKIHPAACTGILSRVWKRRKLSLYVSLFWDGRTPSFSE